jgi:uncharacterized RDD family membrane protein YckC
MTNPYAPPRAFVRDIADPSSLADPADRETRLGASFLDGVIFMAMVPAPVVFAAMKGGSGLDSMVAAIVVGLPLAVVGFIVWCGLTIMYMWRNGQSIGKKLLDIKVVLTDGSPVSIWRIIWLRNVVNVYALFSIVPLYWFSGRIIWLLTFVTALNSIVPLYWFVDALFIFGESRQCLHDKIAGTIVVDA